MNSTTKPKRDLEVEAANAVIRNNKRTMGKKAKKELRDAITLMREKQLSEVYIQSRLFAAGHSRNEVRKLLK
jgi:predicted nucleic acid-binding protein